MTDTYEIQSLTAEGVRELLAFPTIKHGVSVGVHRAVVLQYILWYGLNTTVFLSRVCDSHPDHIPTRAREWGHYLKAIRAL